MDILERAETSTWRDEFFLGLSFGLETEFAQVFVVNFSRV
jgi:hypothetical protein